MSEDIIRVLRVIEYEGPRSAVEGTIKRALHGERTEGKLTIRAATIGVVPEILQKGGDEKRDYPSMVEIKRRLDEQERIRREADPNEASDKEGPYSSVD